MQLLLLAALIMQQPAATCRTGPERTSVPHLTGIQSNKTRLWLFDTALRPPGCTVTFRLSKRTFSFFNLNL